MRLSRQLHLIGERVVRIRPRVVAGAPRSVIRVAVSARNEDLATIEGVGPFSALRGTLDFVDLPVDAMRDAKAVLTLSSVDGDPSNAFHVDVPQVLGAGRALDPWMLPVEIFLTLERPTDPQIDPTDPWTWDASQQPELRVLSIAMHTL